MSAAYTEPKFQDDCCDSCGALLPLESTPLTWEDHGYCSMRCAVRSASGFYLSGSPAIELAIQIGRLGGPGFERDLVRAWLKAQTPEAPAMLSRLQASETLVGASPDSWCWRLMSGGECHAMRLTAKEVR